MRHLGTAVAVWCMVIVDPAAKATNPNASTVSRTHASQCDALCHQLLRVSWQLIRMPTAWSYARAPLSTAEYLEWFGQIVQERVVVLLPDRLIKLKFDFASESLGEIVPLCMLHDLRALRSRPISLQALHKSPVVVAGEAQLLTSAGAAGRCVARRDGQAAGSAAGERRRLHAPPHPSPPR